MNCNHPTRYIYEFFKKYYIFVYCGGVCGFQFCGKSLENLFSLYLDTLFNIYDGKLKIRYN